jgi:DNA-binding transcriptional regulator YiaG
MKKKYESEQLMAIHQSAEALFKLGIIDAAEMEEYDEGCLAPTSKPARNVPEAKKAEHPITA